MSVDINQIIDMRVNHPEQIGFVMRDRGMGIRPNAKFLMIAADDPARGNLAAGGNPRALEDRWDLLDRLCQAFAIEGVKGCVGAADLVEDLTIAGVLKEKFVIGSMNRGGLADSSFELDDVMSGYDIAGIHESRLDGGKMLLRLDYSDEGSSHTLSRCARGVCALNASGRIALLEAVISSRDESGRVRTHLDMDSICLATAIASGLGTTSGLTWLMLPLCEDVKRLVHATTLPIVLRVDFSTGVDALRDRVQEALSYPNIIGIMADTSLVYPSEGSVEDAVKAALELIA